MKKLIKKVKINSNKRKFAFYRTIKFLSLITAFIGTLALFIPLADILWNLFPFKSTITKIILEILMILAIYLIISIVIFVIFYLLKKIIIKKNKLKITICKGDILNDKFLTINDVLIFAGDIDNTIKFDETNKISKQSIHGQFIEKFSNTINLKKDENFIKEINYSNKDKELKAFLVPLTKIKKENNYKAEVRTDFDFLQICKKTIEYIDGSNCEKILMPIIGGGYTSRIMGYLSDKTHLISLWILLFQIYCTKNRKFDLTFVVTEEDWNLLRFKELK